MPPPRVGQSLISCALSFSPLTRSKHHATWQERQRLREEKGEGKGWGFLGAPALEEPVTPIMACVSALCRLLTVFSMACQARGH